VSDQPETRYARSGDVHIAYQLLGTGPPDVLLFSFGVLPIDAVAEEPGLDRFHRRLASFGRLIRFDPRGVGLSDPVAPASPPTLEQWMADAVAVLDAAGSERAAVLSTGEASLEALLLATTHPWRVSHLVLVNGTARVARADDYPPGIPMPVLMRFLDVIVEPDAVDQGYDFLAVAAPSTAGDDAFRRWWVRAGNRGASPATAKAILSVRLLSDVRPLLPLVTLPTLVLHRNARFYGVGHGRYLAEHIAGAKLVELPGPDHLFWVGDDTRNMLEEIEEFLTGVRRVGSPDRVLATVLLTDIVGSTERLAEMGESRWRDMLDRHDAAVRRQIERFGGREVKHTGDGVLATFDGPARAVVCATAVREAAAQLGLDIRAGLHTGEVERRGDDIAGMAVHIVARVEALAGAGEILVSRTVVDLTAGSGIAFSDRGEHALKGVPDPWRLYAVGAPASSSG
jgi:class 3 adenylate cyclase